MFHWIYCKPLWEIVFMSFLAVLIWTVCEVAFCGQNNSEGKKRTIWKIVNVVLFIGSLLALLYLTLFARSEDSREVYWAPFHFFQNGPVFEELYRMLVMNAFAFVPFSLTFSASLPEKIPGWGRWLITIFVGLALSIGIETAQYIARLGTVETDDVIFNTLGAIIGGLPVFLADVVKRTGSDKVVEKWIGMGIMK